ncbi:MAG: exonuclease SbcCD subunit D C-terminal domain-containing protein [Myxococcota bacterium]
MKILHTSDWHLGRSLYGRKRYKEFEKFLGWLVQMVDKHNIDALLVSGDIFDTSTPSNKAQRLYYEFLCKVAQTVCRHVVVVGGNHDSPTFLNAPRQLLQALNVHVVGAKTDKVEDEVLELRDNQGKPEAIVGAVPYLRDRDIRTAEIGESFEDKNAKLIEGLRQHYAEVSQLAHQKQQEYLSSSGRLIPIIATGHLFTDGGKVVKNDGVRELYVGTLVHVEQKLFPEEIDYLALGHLHVPQNAGGKEHFRYSGSPLPMGFNESSQQKIVLIVEFAENKPQVSKLKVPVFQELKQISGDSEEIVDQINQLKHAGSEAWLEIEFTGKDSSKYLREELEKAIQDSKLEILKIQNRAREERFLKLTEKVETLEELGVFQVFRKKLDKEDMDEQERKELSLCYREIVQEIHESDTNAE